VQEEERVPKQAEKRKSMISRLLFEPENPRAAARLASFFNLLPTYHRLVYALLEGLRWPLGSLVAVG
jgi:hypothetical protein